LVWFDTYVKYVSGQAYNFFKKTIIRKNNKTQMRFVL